MCRWQQMLSSTSFHLFYCVETENLNAKIQVNLETFLWTSAHWADTTGDDANELGYNRNQHQLFDILVFVFFLVD